MLWNVWPVPSVCPNNMPELSSPNCQKSQSPAPTIFLTLETHWAGTQTNPFTLCSHIPCFVCTVCNLTVLVYLLICFAMQALPFGSHATCVLGCSAYLYFVHCTFLIYIYMKVFLSLYQIWWLYTALQLLYKQSPKIDCIVRNLQFTNTIFVSLWCREAIPQQVHLWITNSTQVE